MSKKKKSGFGKFVTGALVGIGLGVLFAPKKGSQTRKELKMKIDELISSLKEIDVDEVKQNLELKLDEIREQIDELDKETVLKIAKEKGKKLTKKTEELVKLAVEKGTPVLKRTAEDVKDKVIEVIKEVIERLEEE
jgi:gas vesicle protein